MVGGISGVSPYMGIYQYMGNIRVRAAQEIGGVSPPSGARARQITGNAGTGQVTGNAGTGRVQAGQRVATVTAAGHAANTGVPVQAVDQAPAVQPQMTRSAGYVIPFLRQGMDPAELAVRMRMKYIDPAQPERMDSADGVDSTQERECQTCEQRKYQDGSDDSGVSYQTPTHIAPEQAASAVMGHEMEHVVRERAAADREDRKVVSQSVTMHTAICPECGKVYVSGGTTRTVTASDSQPEPETEKDKT